MASSAAKNTAPGRGRPRGESHRDVALGLLEAAEQQMCRKGHFEITSREIAELAGTNQAMISYYYDCKDGLFSTVVENTLRSKMLELTKFEEELPTVEGCSMRAFVGLLMDQFIGSASLYRVILSELSNNRSIIRQRYLGRRTKTFDQVAKIISKMVELGALRPDTDVRQATFTLVCFVSGPITLCPVLDEFHFTMEELRKEHWIDHVSTMMLLRYGDGSSTC